MEEEKQEDPREKLRLFCIEAKARAFMEAYVPAGEDDADDTFSDAELRSFFGAYPNAVGDVLVIYLEDYLVPRGFRFALSKYTKEPVVYVKYNCNI